MWQSINQASKQDDISICIVPMTRDWKWFEKEQTWIPCTENGTEQTELISSNIWDQGTK